MKEAEIPNGGHKFGNFEDLEKTAVKLHRFANLGGLVHINNAAFDRATRHDIAKFIGMALFHMLLLFCQRLTNIKPQLSLYISYD